MVVETRQAVMSRLDEDERCIAVHAIGGRQSPHSPRDAASLWRSNTPFFVPFVFLAAFCSLTKKKVAMKKGKSDKREVAETRSVKRQFVVSPAS